MRRITHVHAREVLDSRGRPTVEVELRAGETLGRAIVPSGASTGRAEALELRDGDPARYDGLGVLRAVDNVNLRLRPAVIGLDPADQAALDRRIVERDGSVQKSRLGANALLGVSLAAAHLAAALQRVPLAQHLNQLWNETAAVDRAAAPRVPLPMTNMISGGLHAGGNLDFQDFLVVPAGAENYPQALEWLVRVARRLARLLVESGYEGRLLADEGGFGPQLADAREALHLLVRAIGAAGLRPGSDVTVALDVASSHFFDERGYTLAAAGGRSLSSGEMIDELTSLVDEFPIVSVEDGLAEEDWSGWQALTARLGGRVRLVGDDLLATNPARLQRAIELRAGNAVLVKVNQIGTLSETLQFMRLASEAGYWRVVSARSGETEDTTIADLAVGTAAEMIKIGSIHHGERLAKYNQLLRLAESGYPYRGAAG